MSLNYDERYVRELAATRSFASHPDVIPSLAQDWLAQHATIEQMRKRAQAVCALHDEVWAQVKWFQDDQNPDADVLSGSWSTDKLVATCRALASFIDLAGGWVRSPPAVDDPSIVMDADEQDDTGYR